MELSERARQFIEKEADEKVATLREDLLETVRTYCRDIDIVENGCNNFLDSMPRHEEETMDAFIAWKTLKHVAGVLDELAIEAKHLRHGHDPIAGASLTNEDRKPTIDDDEVRRSAGYNSDKDVADSSLTDKARDHRISEFDIGESAKGEDFTYRDNIEGIPDPAEIYRKSTRALFTAIMNRCVRDPEKRKPRLPPIIRLRIDTVKNINHILGKMHKQLKRGLRVPKSDDQMS